MHTRVRFSGLAAAFFVLSASLPARADVNYRLPVRAQHGMVSSSDEMASQVGVEILRRGGNAVDAAVAVALMLAVTWPEAGNIGGGGFMMIRRADGRMEAIDYREVAPLAATHDMYAGLPKGSTDGPLASGVPGTIAGLALALERHGTMKWKDLVEPARRAARDGFLVNTFFERSLRDPDSLNKLQLYPEARRVFLRDGKGYKFGDRFRQPELAATLSRLQKRGPREFYEGETARLIVEEMKRSGGIITAEDLRRYVPAVREPLRSTYRGAEIVTMPPPSSGGVVLLQMLQMLEPYDLAASGFGSAATDHLLIEVMRRAFADRAVHLGDTDFVDVPLEALLSRAYADKRRATIDLARATPSSEILAGEMVKEPTETTHFTIVDREGNVVSNTYTLNDWYGSGVMVTGAGFLMNDEMDDFAANPGKPNMYGLIQGEGNAIQPRKRPLSSMTPTFVLKDGKFWFAAGSPGGPRIISTVLQVILNVIDFEMTLKEAVEAPRIHHQWLPDEVRWERLGMNADTRAVLERMGHRFSAVPLRIGDAQCVMIDPVTGHRLGGSDTRLGGVAIGY